jgi:hypothetical protein
MAHTAMFTGLVFDPEGHVAEVTWVGENACYVVYEDDFKRHIDAEMVDRQVLRFMRQQVEGSRDLAVGAMLDMMGRDDLFTKAAVESTIDRMEDAVGQPIRKMRPVAGHVVSKLSSTTRAPSSISKCRQAASTRRWRLRAAQSC